MATQNRLDGYDPLALEAFLQAITKHRDPYDQYDMGYVDAAEHIENWLEHNAVDAVQVVRGHWVCLEPEIGYYACSVCDHRILRAKCNCCPNCFARMDEMKRENEVEKSGN